MFLTSDALRTLDARRLQRWDWGAVTILYISYEWNPDRDGAQGITGRRLVKALLHAGARVHVLASSRADEEIRDSRYHVTVVPSPPLVGSRRRRSLEMLRCGIPEPAGVWVAGAVEAGTQVLSSLPADTMLYSRAMPGASNIVAWRLARLAALPWVAHFSDEWPPPYVLANGRGWRAPYKWPLFEIWRRRIFRDAGALTFTNPRQAKDILSRGGARYLPKAFVVTHLASQLTARNHPLQYDTFHIVHTGNLYIGRSSAALMQGLRLFLDRTPEARERVRFTVAGWALGDFPAWTERCGLGDVVRFVGRVNQAKVLELIDDASLLIAVDFGRPDSTTVVSKIPDYLNARRPILAITAPSSSMGCLFNGDGAGLTAHYHSPEQVAERLGAVFEAWQRRRLEPFLPQRPAIESYDCRQVLTELAGAFEAACRARGLAAPGSKDRAGVSPRQRAPC